MDLLDQEGPEGSEIEAPTRRALHLRDFIIEHLLDRETLLEPQRRRTLDGTLPGLHREPDAVAIAAPGRETDRRGNDHCRDTAE